MGRRFLKREAIDSSEYHINLGEISRTESDDAWDFLISWEQNRRLDVEKYVDLRPENVNIPLRNHPITVSHIVVSGSDNLEFPLIPVGKFEELVIENNEHNVNDIDVDIWRIIETAAVQMTTTESAVDKDSDFQVHDC